MKIGRCHHSRDNHRKQECMYCTICLMFFHQIQVNVRCFRLYCNNSKNHHIQIFYNIFELCMQDHASQVGINFMWLDCDFWQIIITGKFNIDFILFHFILFSNELWNNLFSVVHPFILLRLSVCVKLCFRIHI